jgi:hypothetical protein
LDQITAKRPLVPTFRNSTALTGLPALAGVGGAVAVGLTRANVESLGIAFLLLIGLIVLAIQLARVHVYD